jgi:hypothetical protein
VIRNRELPKRNDDSTPLLLSDKDAAAFIGVSTSYLRKSRCDGVIANRTQAPPFVRVGGRVLYRRSDLVAWVAALEGRDAI